MKEEKTVSEKTLMTSKVLYRISSVLAPLLGLAPSIRLQILIRAPPSDKRLLQISLDVDQKDGDPELFLNQLTSKSLGLFFFIEYSVKYMYAVQKMISS